MKSILLAILLFPCSAFGQLTKQDSIWLPFATFIGTWQGTGGGEPGIGKYERSYGFILGKRFIEVRNKSIYPPTTINPDGEKHEDVGYISYDKVRKTFVLRQFHVEGFVNQYVLDSVSVDRKILVFRTEAIENIPKGWQAKESYLLTSVDEIMETFELAAPGKSFEVYTKVTLHRVK